MRDIISPYNYISKMFLAIKNKDINELKKILKECVDGYILRNFKRNLSTNPSLTPASINHILKNIQKKARLNQIGELSVYSFRVGAVLDLLDKNIPLEKIMFRGG
jgi:hypothetical protein